MVRISTFSNCKHTSSAKSIQYLEYEFGIVLNDRLGHSRQSSPRQVVGIFEVRLADQWSTHSVDQGKLENIFQYNIV